MRLVSWGLAVGGATLDLLLTAGGLAGTLFSILTTLTNNDQLIWRDKSLNILMATLGNVVFAIDQPNNEPVTFSSVVHHYGPRGHAVIEDNGSGGFGILELRDAIHKQRERLSQEKPKDPTDNLAVIMS